MKIKFIGEDGQPNKIGMITLGLLSFMGVCIVVFAFEKAWDDDGALERSIEAEKQEVIQEGHNAYLAGIDVNINPHEGTHLENEWVNGWAQSAIEDK